MSAIPHRPEAADERSGVRTGVQTGVQTEVRTAVRADERPVSGGPIGGVRRVARIAVQSGLLAAVWIAADAAARDFRLPVPGGVLGLVVLLLLLFSGKVAPKAVKAGSDWLLSEMLLFFLPAAVSAIQYGGLFKEDGWRLALVVVAGTVIVMFAVAVAVEQTARLERRFALRRAVAQASHCQRQTLSEGALPASRLHGSSPSTSSTSSPASRA